VEVGLATIIKEKKMNSHWTLDDIGTEIYVDDQEIVWDIYINGQISCPVHLNLTEAKCLLSKLSEEIEILEERAAVTEYSEYDELLPMDDTDLLPDDLGDGFQVEDL
jgi:hypothetical protein